MSKAEVGWVSPFEDILNDKKRAFLEAFAVRGTITGAAVAAGVSHTTYYTEQWKSDEQFQDAMRQAERMAAEGLVDEARRRATEGLKAYKFTTGGEAVRHPEECECGHHASNHERRRLDADGAEVPRRCGECTCAGFVGRPYYEHKYSDTMLIFLMKGQLPDIYGDRMRVEAQVSNIDIERLPDHLVARIAGGENVMAVLASAAMSEVEARTLLGSGKEPDATHEG